MDKTPQTMAQALRSANEYVVTAASAGRAAASPGVAFIQPGEEKRVSFSGVLKNGGGDDKKGESTTVGTGIGQGKGKQCYHCGEVHTMWNCPKLTKEQKIKLYAERKARLAAEGTADAGAAAGGNIQEGQVHLGVSEEDIAGIDEHPDDYNEEYAFIQPASSHPAVVQARRTLDKNKVYLDSTSTFNQVFEEELLDHQGKVSTTLRAHCNAGVSHADEKGILLGMFDCWL